MFQINGHIIMLQNPSTQCGFLELPWNEVLKIIHMNHFLHVEFAYGYGKHENDYK